MAQINLEILFYLIWTKLLVWTRCPQQVGAQPPQPRWARSGPKICHCDHGVHMNPWFFNSSPFMQQIRSTSLLSLDLILYPETVSQEKPDIFLLLPPLLRLSCLHVLGKLRRKQKECMLMPNNQHKPSNYLDAVGYRRPWTLKLEWRCLSLYCG